MAVHEALGGLATSAAVRPKLDSRVASCQLVQGEAPRIADYAGLCA
ncbi:MAG: hypothetical protein WCZ20_00270 [Hydrogenophaga sp.]|nr:hypothetical protein [Ottowia sp.]